MNHQNLLNALFFWLSAGACARELFFGSNSVDDAILCTPECSDDYDVITFYGAPCSCSRSCLTYGDCCRDAPYENTGKDEMDLGCITLDGLGQVSVVNNCPSSWSMETEACAKHSSHSGPGTNIPVTSRETGISYSSYECALCNNDNYSLITWPVKLLCCLDKEGIVVSSEEVEVSGMTCDCAFYPQNDITFAMSLELRKCPPARISTCSSTWTNESTKKLCSSYLDSVYNGEKIYRNSYCASCNYEDIEMLKCSVVRSLEMESF